MVSFSCRISPLTLTVIFFDKSPLAIAVATSAMLRTWAVRLPAIELTLSVRCFQVPATPGPSAWPPSLPAGAPPRAGGRASGDVADLAGEVGGHRVDAVGQVLPAAGHAAHQCLAAELAFGADLARDARHLAGEGVELVAA